MICLTQQHILKLLITNFPIHLIQINLLYHIDYFRIFQQLPSSLQHLLQIIRSNKPIIINIEVLKSISNNLLIQLQFRSQSSRQKLRVIYPSIPFIIRILNNLFYISTSSFSSNRNQSFLNLIKSQIPRIIRI